MLVAACVTKAYALHYLSIPFEVRVRRGRTSWRAAAWRRRRRRAAAVRSLSTAVTAETRTAALGVRRHGVLVCLASLDAHRDGLSGGVLGADGHGGAAVKTRTQ